MTGGVAKAAPAMPVFAIAEFHAALHNSRQNTKGWLEGRQDRKIWRHTMRKFLFPAIAASLVVPVSSGAAAEEVTEVVSFADLDLRTPDGLLTLEGRIADAVISVCGEPVTPSLWAKRAVDDCRAAAADGAKAQLEARLASLPPVSVAAAE